MTPTMRERVARAIASVPPQSGQSAEDWMLARADAAIGAMMEPTQEMLRAAEDACDIGDDGGWSYGAPSLVWPMMIRAALAEKA